MTTEPSPTPAPKSMDAIMALCKRRGFIFQASDIYGGINGFWDYGPLGAQMKKNLREAWWQDMILNPAWGRKGPNGERVKCVPVETRIIQHPKVWEASGHVGGFNDPMRMCRSCNRLLRSDHVQDMLRLSPWYQSLRGQFLPTGAIDGSTLLKWVRSEGRKLAPAMAKVLEVPGVFASDLMMKFHGRQPTDEEVRAEKERQLREYFNQGSPYDFAKAVDYLNGGVHRMAGTPVKAPYSVWATLGFPGAPPLPPQELVPCPHCGGMLGESKPFNLMFFSYTGAVFDEANKVYLRPETAQGVFLQFKNVVDSTRVRVPFGIGNTGTSFRNEVTPRNFTFRSREFEQAELEFFCHPSESFEWYKFWRDFRMQWWQSIGLAGENLILREHDKDELSHYSQGTSDVEYRFPFTSPGFGELEGIAHRGDYDLTQHQKHSGTKLDYFDTTRGETLPNGSKKGERYMPHCIEPAAGLDRGVLALLCEAYTVDASRPSPELLKLHPRIAPIKAAIFPLMDKDGMPEVAEKLYDELFAKFGKTGFIEMDAKQSIGKRYARMDEAGCPFCFTIDQETLTAQTVTVRDRDTGKQERIGLDKVAGYLGERLGS